MGDLDVQRMWPVARRGMAVIGAVGHLARAVSLAVIGLLVGRAAVFVDAWRVGGLDAALRVLGETGPGSVLLVAMALGLAVYGIFCPADTLTRRACSLTLPIETSVAVPAPFSARAPPLCRSIAASDEPASPARRELLGLLVHRVQAPSAAIRANH
jgi:hypothetical protein